MKCPYCEYEHGWSNEKLGDVKGDKGDFFTTNEENPLLRVDVYSWRRVERKEVFGCPSCGKLFIEVC